MFPLYSSLHSFPFLNIYFKFWIHVQNVQVCYIGIHVPWWFAGPTGPNVCCSLPLSMCSCCSAPTYEWEHAVFGFLFLCLFAENNGFQHYPCPCKGHELILFYGYIVFHGVYVLHFLYPVYHWWACGLVPSLCCCKQCCNEHTCACIFIIQWFIILWVYTQ